MNECKKRGAFPILDKAEWPEIAIYKAVNNGYYVLLMLKETRLN